MRILAFADKHPTIPVRDIIDQTSPDIIVLCGDLTPDPFRGLPSHIPAVGVYGNHCPGRWFPSCGIRELTNDPWTWNGSTWIGRSGCRRYKSATAFGDDFQYTDDQDQAFWSSAPSADVVVTHAPPVGIHDSIDDAAPLRTSHPSGCMDQIQRISTTASAWSDVIGQVDQAHVGWLHARSWLHDHRPALWLHGHTYPAEDRWSMQMDRTIVRHVSGHACIDTAMVHRMILPSDIIVPAPDPTPLPTPSSWWKRLLNKPS
jgi:Icc-related predicted phosphoesterase